MNKPIRGYGHRYSVTDSGDVVSNPRLGSGNRTNSSLILKGQVSNNGYRFVTLSKDGLLKRFSVHRLVASHFLPPADGKMQVNHIDGNKLNNAVSNLEWVSCSDNQLHAQRMRLSANGERSRLSKLTEEQVLEIRRLYKPRVHTAARLAKEYGVSENGIFHIIKRDCWKYI